MSEISKETSGSGACIRSAYDVIVVGAGMAGLTAAALLAKSGKSVLVVERHDRPGGYAHSFGRGPYLFDAAVHLIGGCGPAHGEPGGLIYQLLGLLGVRADCTFLSVDPFYTAIYPGMRLEAPLGREAFIEAHVREFPSEARGFRALVELSTRIHHELPLDPVHVSFWQMVQVAKRFPELRRYERATVSEVMDEFIEDPRLKSAFTTLWPFPGLPPSRLSFVYWSMLLMSYIDDGAFYCQGSFQRLARALARGVTAHGGEIVFECGARRIVSDDGHVGGVVLGSGQRVNAPVVISNADATQTFEELIGVEHLPTGFVQAFRQLRPSLSAFVVYLATDLDLRALGIRHETLAYPTWDHDETYARMCSGEVAGAFLTVPTLTDPSLAPPGQHLIVALTLLPFEIGSDWANRKQQYTDAMVELIAGQVPGLRENIRFIEAATPRTMYRYTRNLAGAMYGWEHTPDQAGAARLSHETPLRGLYLAGHWTQPGGGVYPTVGSGLGAAQLVLGYENAADLLAALARTS